MASGGSNLEEKVEHISINEKNDINILLLGETGVGKSTFINSVANYLTYEDLREAENKISIVLIPTMFSTRDKYGNIHDLEIGIRDVNEVLTSGVSGTQNVKTYVFPIWDGRARVRLIDTPGMGDTRGVRQDNINSENILAYISQLHELHAICFLFKPNQSRSTFFFKYCMEQILSRLDKSACENIIFAITHTRGSDYGPGDAINLLKKEIDDIRRKPPHSKIPIEKNIFCFDNETFRYLAAVEKGVEYSNSIKDRNEESWNISVDQCWKMIHYIVGDSNNSPLKPHNVQSTRAVNEARRRINQLAQPLAEISQHISHNMLVLARHEENLKMDHQSLEVLRTKLYIPTIELEVVKMTKPATVCTTYKCAEVHQVSGRNVWHYKQRCHDPCTLKIKREVIGAPELINCNAMNGNNDCEECGCSFRVHQHIYYMTKVKNIEGVDSTVEKNINDKEKIVEEAENIIKDIVNKKEELDNEHRIILTTCARFAHFLQNNAITPFSDSYEDYISRIIEREQSMGKFCVQETVEYMQKLCREYNEIKYSFEEALKLGQIINIVSPKEICDSIQDLYKLKHNGETIKELYECQQKVRAKEHENLEYIHKTTSKWKPKQKGKTKKDDKKSADNKNDSRNRRQGGGSQSGSQYKGLSYRAPAPARTAYKSELKQDKGKTKEEDDKKSADNKKDDIQGSGKENSRAVPVNRYENQTEDPYDPPPSYQEAQKQSPHEGPQGAHPPHGDSYPPPAPSAIIVPNAHKSETEQDKGKTKEEEDKKSADNKNDDKKRSQGGGNNNVENATAGLVNRYVNQRPVPDIPPPSHHQDAQNQPPYKGPPQGAYQPYEGYHPAPPPGAYYGGPHGAYPPYGGYYPPPPPGAHHVGPHGAYPPYGGYYPPPPPGAHHVGPHGAYPTYGGAYPPAAPSAYGANAYKSEPKQDEVKTEKEDVKKSADNKNDDSHDSGKENSTADPDDRYVNQRPVPDIPPPSHHQEAQNEHPYKVPPQGAYQPYGGYYPPPSPGAYYGGPHGAYPPYGGYYHPPSPGAHFVGPHGAYPSYGGYYPSPAPGDYGANAYKSETKQNERKTNEEEDRMDNKNRN